MMSLILLVTYSPPNSCMPNKANISMNKKRRKRRDTIERILLSKDTTRFRNEAQYLKTTNAPLLLCCYADHFNASKLSILCFLMMFTFLSIVFGIVFNMLQVVSILY